MRRAPPTVPGTPMRPSIPPRSFLAQKVTVRPRSAAASTSAKLPSRTMSGLGETSCSTTHGSSPSPTSKFEAPPRNLCGTPCASRRFKSSGMALCFVMRSKSVMPPMPREVSSAKEVAGFSCTPSSGSATTIWESSMRMMCRMLGPQEDHQFVARAADVSRTDRKYRVAWTRFSQHELDARLHRAEVVNVFVAGFANAIGERFAGDAGNRGFAGGVDVQQHQYVSLIERPAEFVPEMLRA